jgi:hypothetical protein
LGVVTGRKEKSPDESEVSEDSNPEDGLLTMLKRVFSADQDQILPHQPTEAEEFESDPHQVEAETGPEPESRQQPVAPKPPTISPISEPRRNVSSAEIEDMILNALLAMPNAPKDGMTVTVYGYNPWNAMVTIAPGLASSATVKAIRGLLARIVDEMRDKIQIEIPGERE